MSRRRSTIHDAAALRLHPSGVRVNDDVQNALHTEATRKNKTRSRARRLEGGNWIATDAGGSGRVTKRRKIGEGQTKDIEARTSLTADGQGDAETAGSQGQLEEMPVKVYKDVRSSRRVAFEKDFTFLAAPTSVPRGDISHLQPSSDFLKCIHHFASQYYGSRGQLFDSAGEYRKVKKENRRQRDLQVAASGSQDFENIQEESGDGEEGEQPESDDSSKEALPSPRCKRERNGKEKAKSGTIRKKQKDMFKGFDGSALLCIGMLLHSHIASSFVDNIPEAWEEDGVTYSSEESRGDADSDSTEMQENGL